MDRDFMEVGFSGRDLQEVATKMVMFLNAIKGVNLANVSSETDGERLLQGERPRVSEGEPGSGGGVKKDTK